MGKVTGITVLVIVIILAVLLLFPVRYGLDVDIDRRSFRFRVNWLFRLIRFRFLYDEGAEAVLSIFFFRIDFMDRERRRVRKKKRGKRKAKKAARPEGGFARAKRYLGRAGRALTLARKYGVVELAWPRLRTFLFRIRPRRLTGSVTFGMNDPSLTGRIIGGLSMVSALYQTDLRICPDFEAEKVYFKGDVAARGHVLMLHAVILLVALFGQRDFRMFMNEMRSRE